MGVWTEHMHLLRCLLLLLLLLRLLLLLLASKVNAVWVTGKALAKDVGDGW